MSATHSHDVKTLAEARREFAGKRSPWLIAAVILILLVARGFAGDVTWRDGVAAVAMLAIYPLGEWAIHVYLLHMRPFEFRGRRIDPPAAKGHRAHHRKPNDLTIILLEPKDIAQLLFIAMPVSIAIWAVPLSIATGSVPVAAILTAALTNTVGDRVLGTFPDHRDVTRSKTARTLDPGASGT